MRYFRMARWLGIGGAVIFVTMSMGAVPASANVPGTYHFELKGAGVASGTMTITGTTHTWSLAFTIATWSGTYHRDLNQIALTITAATDPVDVGCVFSGIVDRAGISSARKPGTYTCPGSPGASGTWYAVKTG